MIVSLVVESLVFVKIVCDCLCKPCHYNNVVLINYGKDHVIITCHKPRDYAY